MNLSKIICGSQGTLGIITRIKVKLLKKDSYASSFVLFLSKTDNMALIIQELLKHNPDSLELYDDHTFRIAMKYLPNIIGKMKGNIFSLFWQFIP
ncbi:MAG: FAD-binding oxidoreductase, partial [Candidatus Pacebacteria bacterium]|nr:FAD-binding oxidoreductase [Candidatus Paceibacterota bacterium]